MQQEGDIMIYAECAKAVLLELEGALLGIADGRIEALIKAITGSGRIFCDGMGRSGLQADSFAMRLSQMGFTSYVVSETTTPSIAANDLLLICSGSGETPVLVEHARRAKAVGASIALITVNESSALGDIAFPNVVINAQSKAGQDASIQPMGTLFEQSLGVFLDIMVLFLMKEMMIDSEAMFRNHKNLE
ncbi:MAG: 6-phospho-3-hexuloisomerase [Lachnospiraceae bacterium]